MDVKPTKGAPYGFEKSVKNIELLQTSNFALRKGVCYRIFFFWKCEKNTLYWVYRMNTTTGNITPLPVSLADVSESTRGWLNVGVIDATTQCLIQWPTTYTNWCPVLSFQLPFPSMSLWNNDRWTWTTVVCFQFSLSVTARMRQAIHEQ